VCTESALYNCSACGEVVSHIELDNTDDLVAVEHECKSKAVKNDAQKPDLSLVPVEFLNEVARAMMDGERKYGRYNYLKGMDWHRLVAAALRHINAFQAGEDNATDSGVSHIGHAGACLCMLAVYVAKGLGKDTRWK
jgi:hypothetical protein